jgi:hypothetical protein
VGITNPKEITWLETSIVFIAMGIVPSEHVDIRTMQFQDLSFSIGMPFRQLGDYKIGKTIGAGAFSKVKVATHIPSKQKVPVP